MLGYKEDFGPYKVPSTKVRKLWIDTHAILSIIILEERKNIFGERGVPVLFFSFFFDTRDCILQIE